MSAREKLLAVLGVWGRPPDVPAKIALAFAVVFLAAAAFGRGRSALGLGAVHVSTRRWLGISALVAALLSVAYTAVYLRGGPRIIDASTYWLQGRAFFDEGVRFPILYPSASFRGRFLLATGDGTLAGIFPPGHPLLLAFGFALGAPMIIGPLLAAGIVVATHRLARALAEELLPDEESRETVARTAVVLSIVCGALRYHTADTMAHGATALGVALALERALVAARGGAGAKLAATGAGLALGYVAATRPVSAIPIAIVSGALVLRNARPTTLRFALGIVPGLLLLAWAQRSATGSWLTSSQRAYYALADGPENCFRYGFGAGVGCLHEHGDFVRARLATPDGGHGYGLAAALGTTLRRLHLHLADVANLELLALVALASPLVRALRTRASLAAIALVALQVLAYAPFYFDGSYPGGGARYLADVLPVEHALLAAAAVGFAATRAARQPGREPGRSEIRAASGLIGLALLGFAVHASHAHVELAWRDGGRPFFEPDVLARNNVKRGLVFVDSDHAFGLAHQPGAVIPTGLVVARLREDDHDGLLVDLLGKPSTWRYTRGTEERGKEPEPATITPFVPPAIGTTLRFESESDWPPLAQSGGFAVPVWTDACAGGQRALVLTPDATGGAAQATIALPVPKPGRYRVTPRVMHGVRVPGAAGGPDGPAITGTLRVGDHTFTWTEQAGRAASGSVACEDLAAVDIVLEAPAGRPEIPIVIEAKGGPVALDRVVIQTLGQSFGPKLGK